jgi:hypothetical protein
MERTTTEKLRRPVALSLADPWELAERTAADRIGATIVGIHAFKDGAESEAIAVRLDQPLAWQGLSYPVLLIAARHGQGLLEALSGDADLDCNYVGVPDDAVLQGEGIARCMQAWRGGLAGRVGVQLRS